MPVAKNILLLCTDEYRGDMLAANGLNPDIQTPHLDALARRGVNFRRHFTPFPKCVPARVAMMNGRYSHTDGYRNITQLMPCGTPDLASTLRGHGYQLVELGRNHCWEHMLAATQRPPELKPGERGLAFDYHAWTPPFKAIWDRHKATDADIRFHDPEALEQGRGFVHRDDRGWSGDYAITEMAERFLAEVRDPARPFFCQVNIGKPHPVYATDDPWFSMYDRAAMAALPYDLPRDAPYCLERQRAVRSGHDCPHGAYRALQSTYMGMCSRVDLLMGRLIDAVERAGLWDDTVVVLTSDHGDYCGQYGIPEKWDTHFPDCLMHVPMIMAGGQLPEGVTVDSLTEHTDLAPTLCDLLDLEPFAGIHGTTMRPAISGHPTRDAVFADGGHEPEMRARFNQYQTRGQPTPGYTAADYDRNPPDDPARGDGKQETYRLFPDTMARAKMVRTERWKYVHRETGDHELYDLRADRWEMSNLYLGADAEQRGVINDLRARLLDWALATDTDRPRQAMVGA